MANGPSGLTMARAPPVAAGASAPGAAPVPVPNHPMEEDLVQGRIHRRRGVTHKGVQVRRRRISKENKINKLIP